MVDLIHEFVAPKIIYSYLSSGKNMLVRDDYYWWASHDKMSPYGKPLYVDFDDNEQCFIFLLLSRLRLRLE